MSKILRLLKKSKHLSSHPFSLVIGEGGVAIPAESVHEEPAELNGTAHRFFPVSRLSVYFMLLIFAAILGSSYLNYRLFQEAMQNLHAYDRKVHLMEDRIRDLQKSQLVQVREVKTDVEKLDDKLTQISSDLDDISVDQNFFKFSLDELKRTDVQLLEKFVSLHEGLAEIKYTQDHDELNIVNPVFEPANHN